MPTFKKTIKDRNLVSFLVALGFQCEFIPRTSAVDLDGEFERTPELDKACIAYASNALVPVQSFVTASRVFGLAIRDHKRQYGGQL